MLPLSLQIAVQLVGPARARPPIGTGRVERVVDQNTVVIRVRAQDVTVRLLDGALDVGDTVRIQQDGAQILLEKVPSTLDGPKLQTPPADVWTENVQSRAHLPLPTSAGPATSQTVFVASGVSTGASIRNEILLFENGAQARQWLSDNGFARGVGAAAGSPPALELETQVAVRTFPFEQGQIGAVALAAKDAVAEFRYIAAQDLQSAALRNTPPEVLMQVLGDRGAVSVDRLIAIDRAVLSQPPVSAPEPVVGTPAAVDGGGARSATGASMSVPVTPASADVNTAAVPQRAQIDAMVQWLNTALDADVEPSALPGPPSANSAVALLRDAQSVVSAARGLGVPVPVATSPLLDGPQSIFTATDAIVAAARGLGLTMEADLLRAVNEGTALPPESLAGLKAMLLRMDDWIGTALSSGPVVPTAGAPVPAAPGSLRDLLVRFVFGFGTAGMEALDTATVTVSGNAGSPPAAQLHLARQGLVALLPQLVAMLDEVDSSTPDTLKTAVGQYLAAHRELLSATAAPLSGALSADSGDNDASVVRAAGLSVQRALTSLVDATSSTVDRVSAQVSAQRAQTLALLTSSAEDVRALVGAVSRETVPRIASAVPEPRTASASAPGVVRSVEGGVASAQSASVGVSGSGIAARSQAEPAPGETAGVLTATLQSRLDQMLSDLVRRIADAAHRSSGPLSADPAAPTTVAPRANGLDAASEALTRAAESFREGLVSAQAALRAAVPALIAGAAGDITHSSEAPSQQPPAVRGGAEASVDTAGRPSWARLDAAGSAGSGSPAASAASTRAEQVLREAVARVLGEIDTIVSRLDKHQSATSTAHRRVVVDAFQQRADALPAPARETSDAAALTQRMALESVRQNVEQVLGRMESLQVLGKQVSTSEGQQQIIALPVRIRDEVAEVRVKLVKRDARQRNGGKHGRYTAALDVCPSCVGDVSAFMEYFPGKNFRLRLELGQDASRAWFERNRPQLAGALEALGLRGVQVDVIRLPKPVALSTSVGAGPAHEPPRGRVDVHA